MAIVKITKNAGPHGKQWTVTIPKTVAEEVSELATHMIVETVPEGVLMRPIAVEQIEGVKP